MSAATTGAASPSYGSDATGLICGYAFTPDGDGQMRGAPITCDQAGPWLRDDPTAATTAATDRNAGFIWLHFNAANTGTEKWLREHTTLSDEFYDTLHQGSRSTRIERADDALIAVINDVLYDFAYGASDISTLWLSVHAGMVISARRHPLRSIDRLRHAVKNGAALRSTLELLTHLLHDQEDVLVGIVRDTAARVDVIEDTLLAGRLDHKRADLGALRRLLVRLQRLLAPEPATLFRLLQSPPAWIASDDTQELRQSTEEFSLVLQDMASLQERIKLLQEEIAARVNEQNNRSLFTLTIVTVLALPINIVAGLLGMNVGGVPLSQHEHGFWIVVAIIVSFTGLAGWLAMRHWRDQA